MKLVNLFRRRDSAATALYGQIVAQARQPDFYLAGVPDTVQGRYEMIALHIFLVLHRLKHEGGHGAKLAQDLFDLLFQDMDRNLRELGTGDLAVGKRIKALAQGLYGRIAAYEKGLAPDNGENQLEQALDRNIFNDCEVSPDVLTGLAGYLRGEVESLAKQSYQDLSAGRVRFNPLAMAPVAPVKNARTSE